MERAVLASYSQELLRLQFPNNPSFHFYLDYVDNRTADSHEKRQLNSNEMCTVPTVACICAISPFKTKYAIDFLYVATLL